MYHIVLVFRAVKRVYKGKLTENNCSEFVYSDKTKYLEYTKMEIALSCRAKRSSQVWDDLRHWLERSSILRVKNSKCSVVPINLYAKVMPRPTCERSREQDIQSMVSNLKIVGVLSWQCTRRVGERRAYVKIPNP